MHYDFVLLDTGSWILDTQESGYWNELIGSKKQSVKGYSNVISFE